MLHVFSIKLDGTAVPLDLGIIRRLRDDAKQGFYGLFTPSDVVFSHGLEHDKFSCPGEGRQSFLQSGDRLLKLPEDTIRASET